MMDHHEQESYVPESTRALSVTMHTRHERSLESGDYCKQRLLMELSLCEFLLTLK